MKALLAPALILLSLPLFAQSSAPATTTPPASTTATPPPPGGGYAAMMEQAYSTLTPAEKGQLDSARVKAMAQNPDLQSEEMDLMQKMMALQQGDATDADKASLREAMTAHGDKVRAAMIKVDPGVEAIIKKVEAAGDKIRAQAQAAAGQ